MEWYFHLDYTAMWRCTNAASLIYLSLGIFPEIWRKENAIPIQKKNDKSLNQNNPPISLLPRYSKMFEKLIFDAVYQHWNTNSLLNPSQSGFRPGDLTFNQLLSITRSIFLALDCNPTLDVRSAFLDIPKAFDSIFHEDLMYRLSRNGVSGKLLMILKKFLSNRKQRTILNRRTSRLDSIKAGVPQSSVLGPLLFLVYINNVTDDVRFHSTLSSNDITILLLLMIQRLKSWLEFREHFGSKMENVFQTWHYKASSWGNLLKKKMFLKSTIHNFQWYHC